MASSTLDGLQQAKLSQPDAIIWEFPIKERQGIRFIKISKTKIFIGFVVIVGKPCLSITLSDMVH
ncbi:MULTISPECIES: hypothetical protein [Planktothrix]|uniref:Uncharacterized protein n=1 Tax=Planktothrix tepida PCC 9214 TaxID=671072 RepID=A0A1J1LRN8_9CYAN|nr:MULTISPECIES: hypothetical protein [Planktothrix]CUR34524.1 hypothetical protein PL9214640531 [Planktothrix tepida PCC 9214]